MKPVVIGLLLGAVLGLVAACFFLYSLWLPITASCILIAGFVASSQFQTRFLPSGLAALAAMALYFGVFWAPSEFAAATAESPAEHASAASLLATRGGHIFGADERAFQHYMVAAKGGHSTSIMVVAEAYLYGHYGQPRDPERARSWLERAQDLGIKGASKSLLDPYHFPENRSEQAEADKASPVCS